MENNMEVPLKTEKFRQMQRTNVCTPSGESGGGWGGGGMKWEIGTDMYTLMHIKWITNKNLLYKKINKIQKFKKQKQLPYDPGSPPLGIYPEKIIIRKDTCTPMFTAALFTIAKTWKQPKCTSTDEWIKKIWCMCVCVCVCIYINKMYMYVYVCM